MAIAELGGGTALRAGELVDGGAGPALAESGAAAAGLSPGPSVAGAWASGALAGAAAVPEQGRPYPAMPARTGYAPRALAFTGAERGYASASAQSTLQASAKTSSKTSAKASATRTAAAKTSSSKATSSKTAAKATSKSTSAELAFLSDPRLSIEDKLFQFMALMQQKSDRELVDAMRQYEDKKAASAAKSTSTSTGKTSGSAGNEKKTSGGGGGGLFGMLGDALGGLAKTVVGGAESLAKDLGGPLLAAGCTAVGLPFLAPVALEVGGALAKTAVSGLASAAGVDELGAAVKSSSSSSVSRAGASASSSASKAASTSSSKAASTSKTTAAADDGELDEKLEMMKLQRLVEKQSTMFAALSNVLKALHESQMSAVNNIR